MSIQECYRPVLLTANQVYTFTSGSPRAVAGFLAVTAGTITIARFGGSPVVLNAFPVTAGVYYPIPMDTGHESVVTLAGGASGTLLVQ